MPPGIRELTMLKLEDVQTSTLRKEFRFTEVQEIIFTSKVAVHRFSKRCFLNFRIYP